MSGMFGTSEPNEVGLQPTSLRCRKDGALPHAGMRWTVGPRMGCGRILFGESDGSEKWNVVSAHNSAWWGGPGHLTLRYGCWPRRGGGWLK